MGRAAHWGQHHSLAGTLKTLNGERALSGSRCYPSLLPDCACGMDGCASSCLFLSHKPGSTFSVLSGFWGVFYHNKRKRSPNGSGAQICSVVYPAPGAGSQLAGCQQSTSCISLCVRTVVMAGRKFHLN